MSSQELWPEIAKKQHLSHCCKMCFWACMTDAGYFSLFRFVVETLSPAQFWESLRRELLQWGLDDGTKFFLLATILLDPFTTVLIWLFSKTKLVQGLRRYYRYDHETQNSNRKIQVLLNFFLDGQRENRAFRIEYLNKCLYILIRSL